MLKLYDCTTAPSPRRARMLLAEKNIEHENIQVDLKTGEQMGDAYSCLLYTSPSPRDATLSRMPSSA